MLATLDFLLITVTCIAPRDLVSEPGHSAVTCTYVHTCAPLILMCLQGECIHFHEDLKNLKMDLHYWGQVSNYSLEGQPGPFGPFTMEEDLYAAAGAVTFVCWLLSQDAACQSNFFGSPTCLGNTGF